MPYVFAFYMATIMAFLMCAVIVGVQAGIGPGYLPSVLKVYALAMPVAFCCVVFVRASALPQIALTVHL